MYPSQHQFNVVCVFDKIKMMIKYEKDYAAGRVGWNHHTFHSFLQNPAARIFN